MSKKNIFEQLAVKYKGVTKDISNQEIKTTVIYQGSKQVCDDALEEFKINSGDEELGNIENVRMFQDDGPYWNIEVIYNIDTKGVRFKRGSSYGPKQSELSVRTISMPLESNQKYKKIWNNNLYCTKYVSAPDFASKATYKDDGISSKNSYPGDGSDPKEKSYYAWGKSISDLPQLPSPNVWFCVARMTKPGVESYDMPIYELTEISDHGTQKQSGWAVARKAGRISKPENGDFGITKKFGGNWLCQGGSVRFDGRYWVATVTYAHSPDGWDTDLYKDEK